MSLILQLVDQVTKACAPTWGLALGYPSAGALWAWSLPSLWEAGAFPKSPPDGQDWYSWSLPSPRKQVPLVPTVCTCKKPGQTSPERAGGWSPCHLPRSSWCKLPSGSQGSFPRSREHACPVAGATGGSICSFPGRRCLGRLSALLNFSLQRAPLPYKVWPSSHFCIACSCRSSFWWVCPPAPGGLGRALPASLSLPCPSFSSFICHPPLQTPKTDFATPY